MTAAWLLLPPSWRLGVVSLTLFLHGCLALRLPSTTTVGNASGLLTSDNALAYALAQRAEPNTLFKQDAGVGSGMLPYSRVWHASSLFELRQPEISLNGVFQIKVMYGGLGEARSGGSLPLSTVFNETWLLDVNHANRSPRWWLLPAAVTGTNIGPRCAHAMATLSRLTQPYQEAGTASDGVWNSTIPVLFGGTSYQTGSFPREETLSDTRVWAFNFAALNQLPPTIFFRLYNLGETTDVQQIPNPVWTEVQIDQSPNRPQARKFHTMVPTRIDGVEVIVMFGGATLNPKTASCLDDCDALDETWVLTVQAEGSGFGFVGQWTPIVTSGTRPTARYAHASASLEDRVFVLGGTTGHGFDNLQDLWVLSGTSMGTLQWQPAGNPLPLPVVFGAAGVLSLNNTNNEAVRLNVIGGVTKINVPAWGDVVQSNGTLIYQFFEIFAGDTSGLLWCDVNLTLNTCDSKKMSQITITTPPLNSGRVQGLFGMTAVAGQWQANDITDGNSNDLPIVLLVFGGISSLVGNLYPRENLFTLGLDGGVMSWQWQPSLDGPPAQSKGALAETVTTVDASAQFSSLWLFGGIAQDQSVSGSLWQFSVSSGSLFTWQGVSLAYTNQRPTPRFGHTFKSVKSGGTPSNMIVLFGGARTFAGEPSVPIACGLGKNSSGPGPCEDCVVFSREQTASEDLPLQLLNDLWIFDTEQLLWRLVQPTPDATTGKGPVCRAFHEAAYVEDRMFVFGGISSSKMSNGLPYTDDWYPIFGPCNEGCQRYVLGDLWMLSLQLNGSSGQGASWTLLQPVARQPWPSPRMALGMSAAGNIVLIYGGKAYNKPARANVVGSLEPAGDTWVMEVPSSTETFDTVEWYYPDVGTSPGKRFGHFCVDLGQVKLACTAGWGENPGVTAISWPTGIYILSPKRATDGLDLEWTLWPKTQVKDGLAMVAATGIASKETTVLVNFGGVLQGSYSFSSPDFVSFAFHCIPGYGVPIGCVQHVQATEGFIFDCDCQPCPAGTFATDTDIICQECPGDSWVDGVASQSELFCSACNPTACNSHGACRLVDTTAQCSCDWGWSGAQCEKNYGIPVSILIALAVIGIIAAVWLWRRRNKQQVAKLQGTIAMLNETLKENVELKSVWQIDYDELKFNRRIDDDVGATGEVWAAEWRDVMVAVKILRSSLMMLDESTRLIFEREVSFMRKLRDKNLVLFQGAGYMNDPAQGRVPFIVLEFCSNGSWFSQLHEKDEHPPWPQRLQWAIDAAQGMRFLHGLQPSRLHRDFKPHNCLISQSNVLKVADLGSISTQSDDRAAPNWTMVDIEDESFSAYKTVCDPQKSRPVGTPAYLAPEAYEAATYTTKADVFSYGISLCENLTCALPFLDLSKKGAIPPMIASGQRPSYVRPGATDPESLTIQAYIALMESCWRHDPAARPSFAEICSSLTELSEALK